MRREDLVNPARRLPDLERFAGPDAPRPRPPAGRSSCCLLLHDEACEACRGYLDRLSAHSLLAQHAVYAIVATAPRRVWPDGKRLNVSLGIRLLADPDGVVASAVGATPPAWLVADPWGAVQCVRPVGVAHDWPTPTEIAEWLEYVDAQCPECQGEAL